MPIEGSLYKLDAETLECLSKKNAQNHKDPNYITYLHDVITMTKTDQESNCDRAIEVFNRKGQFMFHEFWGLYEQTFKNIIRDVWKVTPVGKKIYGLILKTKCYTEINDSFTDVYFGVPFTFTSNLRQRQQSTQRDAW